MNAIEIDNFSKIYKQNNAAVNHLTLKIPEGSFFGLLGPNGAGKTTTINFIAGFIRKNSGLLRIFNEEITEKSYQYKAKIGFVLEKPTYIKKLTGEEYLNFAGQMYGLEKKTALDRTTELLEFMELIEKKNKLIETYSAGMKKKISLSAAIIHDPELLILDEPFEGIDPVSAKKIWEVLLNMVKKGKTILLTSHILEIVEKLCNEIAIINKGELVFQEKTDNIRNRFKDFENKEKYTDLEDLFMHLIGEDNDQKGLSWL